MATIFLGYMTVGVAGYLAYPTSVGGNVLNAFSASDPVMQAARALGISDLEIKAQVRQTIDVQKAGLNFVQQTLQAQLRG